MDGDPGLFGRNGLPGDPGVSYQVDKGQSKVSLRVTKITRLESSLIQWLKTIQLSFNIIFNCTQYSNFNIDLHMSQLN